MGLDVYAVWPNRTEEERKAQIWWWPRCSGEVGYLDLSWRGLDMWNETFEAVFGLSWSDFLYPDWDGHNHGEGPDLTDAEERERLTQNQNLLLSYIKYPILSPPSAIREWCKKNEIHALYIIRLMVQNMIYFIDFALSKDNARICFW